MARSRLIKPGFATNEFLAMCSFEARLLFALLPTIADRAGRLEDRPRKIKANLFPFEEVDIDSLLHELAKCDDDQDHPFIVRYQASGIKCIQIVKFAENQNPHRDEKQSELPSCEHDSSTVQPPCSHDATPVQSTAQATDTRLKEQVKGNKNRNKAMELPIDVATNGLPEAVADWLKYKFELGQGYKPKGREQFMGRVINLARERGSPHVAEKLRRAMASGWKGWDFENGNQNGKSRKDTGQRSQNAQRGSLSI